MNNLIINQKRNNKSLGRWKIKFMRRAGEIHSSKMIYKL